MIRLGTGLKHGMLLGIALLGCRWALGAAAPVAPPDDTGSIRYLIRPGDTLISIGRHLLIRPSQWRDLARLNHIRRTNQVSPGSSLEIPVAWLKWAGGEAQVRAVSGRAVRDDSVPIAVGDIVAQGAQIITGHDGSVALELEDHSEIRIPPDTSLGLRSLRRTVGADAVDVQIALPSGRVEVSAQKHRDTGRFEIRTPTAITAVRGTRYRTAYDAQSAGATSETLEGVIGVAAQASAVAVPAGFGTRVNAGQAPLPPVQLLPAPAFAGLETASTALPLHVRFAVVPSAARYRVQLSNREDFQSLEFETLTVQPTTDVPNLPDGTHWLRVRAIDALGLEGLDAVTSLTQHTLPGVPVLQAPQPGAAASGALVFNWSGQAGPFRFELASADRPDAPLIVRTVQTPELSTELPPGRYVWRVQGLNAAGESGPWSAAGAVIQRPMPPEISQLESLPRRAHVARWTPQPGYVAQLQVARDPQFAKLVQDTTSATDQLRLDPLGIGTYYIRVRWTDTVGYRGEFGHSRTITVLPPWWVAVIAAGAVALAVAL